MVLQIFGQTICRLQLDFRQSRGKTKGEKRTRNKEEKGGEKEKEEVEEEEA